jgi:hypothetical protein
MQPRAVYRAHLECAARSVVYPAMIHMGLDDHDQAPDCFDQA